MCPSVIFEMCVSVCNCVCQCTVAPGQVSQLCLICSIKILGCSTPLQLAIMQPPRHPPPERDKSRSMRRDEHTPPIVILLLLQCSSTPLMHYVTSSKSNSVSYSYSYKDLVVSYLGTLLPFGFISQE